jgi:hypothetical protein
MTRPLPDAAMAERAFVYDSVSKTLVCPWDKHQSSEAVERSLDAMCRVLVNEGAPVGVWWVHPDKAPVRVTAEDVREWLTHWSIEKACYRVE